MKQFFLISILSLAFLVSNAQSKRVWLYQADAFYKKADYASALDNYLKTLNDTSVKDVFVLPYEANISNQKLPKKDVKISADKTVPLKDYIDHQIAMCYAKTFDYNHAAPYFKLTSEQGTYPHDKYYYAKSLMNIKNYTDAIENFEAYIASPVKTDSLAKSAQRFMTGCFYAQDSSNVKPEVQIRLADTAVFNRGSASFAAMFWGNPKKMIFTSARKGGVLIDPEKQDSEFLCDLYWTEMENDSTWGKPHNFGRPVNTATHDASGAFTADNVMYFTRWSDEKRNEQKIYLARMMNGKFFEALKLDTSVNIPGYKSVNPFITLDGTQLYFSSNRPGGKGGMDIWVIDIDDNGQSVGKAKNLGDVINTMYDEVTPFYHNVSSTLYFSSNGHPTTGGLDIFKSHYSLDDEAFGLPINLGMPINSSKDDAYMIWDRFLKKGFFSSDREECESGHCYDIYELINGKIAIKIEGTVYDQQTEEPIPNALVTFKDVKGDDEPIFFTTDEKGFYSSDLRQEQELFLKAQKTKYFADAASVNTNGITESTTIVQDFFLKPQPVGGAEIEIPGIEYDFDKATLRPNSLTVLDKLYDFLMLNDNLSVEIKSHTDCRGSDSYNLKLSQERAQSCVTYLLAKGIPISRLKPQGYGETEPIPGHECDTIEKYKADKEKYKEMHQHNRRTAFRVTKEGDLNPVLESVK